MSNNIINNIGLSRAHYTGNDKGAVFEHFPEDINNEWLWSGLFNSYLAKYLMVNFQKTVFMVDCEDKPKEIQYWNKLPVNIIIETHINSVEKQTIDGYPLILCHSKEAFHLACCISQRFIADKSVINLYNNHYNIPKNSYVYNTATNDGGTLIGYCPSKEWKRSVELFTKTKAIVLLIEPFFGNDEKLVDIIKSRVLFDDFTQNLAYSVAKGIQEYINKLSLVTSSFAEKEYKKLKNNI